MDHKTLAYHIAYQVGNALTAVQVLDLTSVLLRTYPPEPEVKFDPTNRESLGAYALTLPKVADAARRDRKIEAIKELRANAQCGLAEAKNAVESYVFTGIYTSFSQGAYAPRPGSPRPNGPRPGSVLVGSEYAGSEPWPSNANDEPPF